MTLAALALGACTPVDLSGITPAHSAYVYELAPPAAMAGMQLAEEWGRGQDGRFQYRSVGRHPAVAHTLETDNESWFGLLNSTQASDRVYRRDDLPALARLAPGESVEVRLDQAVAMRDGPHLVNLVSTVRHLGCRTREVLGARLEVPAYEVTYQSAAAQGRNIQISENSLVREFSPQLGWWVAQTGPMGEMILIEAVR